MRKFLDKDGDSWTIDLTFGAVSRVKQLSDGRYDLLKPEKPIEHPEFNTPVPLQTVFMLDLPSLWEVLYMLVEPEATAKGLKDAMGFADRMSPETLLAARDKFREEWRDFFQQLQRPDQAKALEKIGEWLKDAERHLAEAMKNPLLTQLDQKVAAEMKSSLKISFGKLAESLESTPDHSPGGNSP